MSVSEIDKSKSGKERRNWNKKKKKWLRKVMGPCSFWESSVFTAHALERFKYRSLRTTFWKTPIADIPIELFENPVTLARKILAESREEKFNAHHVKRIIEHGFQETRYFISFCGWRFVILIEHDRPPSVITIERVNPDENY